MVHRLWTYSRTRESDEVGKQIQTSSIVSDQFPIIFAVYLMFT